ncbi:hypothetical protein BDR05DRAFT_896368 [Suillus weaverae]|nr:hypothetical protein BDR05DRAFT_896368 [Suillus weaverae]
MDSQPPIPVIITTPRDHYGVYRQYIHSLPSFNPDNLTLVAHLADSPTFTKNPDSLGARQWWSGFGRSTQAPSTNYFAPFLNATTCRLMSWFYSGSITKSLAELDRLVNEVILAADFDRAELKDFGALKESNRLDNYQGDAEDVRSSFSASDGWIETGVKIRIPADGVRHATEDAAPLFEVPGLFYRKPLKVIKAAFRESAAEHFHLMPFNIFVALLYPHLTCFCQLTDTFQDFYQHVFKKAATAEVLSHCRHELMQAVWLLLLDDDFMHAYEFGIIIECLDGVSRRVFPRFFTYSADYPEKTLLASIKFLAHCPCPRCLIPKIKIGGLGNKADRRWREKKMREDGHRIWTVIKQVREWLYVKGTNITSIFVKRMLAPESLVPSTNAFSTRLAHFGFNFYTMFVPDLLHEFELGVWKATFTHLIRVLYAYGHGTILKLNKRYRQVPTFSRGTIRKFSENASGMKKLTARDFEDLLQVCFLIALRLHTDTTLSFLDTSTTRIGKILRRFSRETETFDTRDLPSEEAARGHRQARKVAQSLPHSQAHENPAKQQPQRPSKHRKFNMRTYKLHALGDYVNTIRRFGTTDNFTTQLGELEHRRVKRFYQRVSKCQYVSGIVKQQRRERILFRMRTRIPEDKSKKKKKTAALHNREVQTRRHIATDATEMPFLRFEDSERLPHTDPRVHYHISNGARHFLSISQWLRKNDGDPAFTEFLPRLKDHILARLLGHDYDGDEVSFSSAQRSQLMLVNDRIYRHKVIRINYTTYDLRREQDSLNSRTHADIMVLSHEDDEANGHPYWYARIIGVFHALVSYRDPAANSSSYDPVQVDFAWVRWFGRDLTHRSGWEVKRLHRLGFIPSEDPGAFGFIDPKHIIRGIHLIPAFAHGHTSEYMSPSIARHPSDNDEDWTYFYLNIFVDRDMLMRFRGGGVGHRTTREATNIFLDDRDPLDTHQASAAVVHTGEEGSNDDESDMIDDGEESAALPAQGEAMELDTGDEPKSGLMDNGEGSAARREITELDEGDESDLDYNNYGYSGIQEVEGEDFDEDKDEDRYSEDGEGFEATEGDGDDEIDDELGAEDGEDSDEELEGFDEF